MKRFEHNHNSSIIFSPSSKVLLLHSYQTHRIKHKWTILQILMLLGSPKGFSNRPASPPHGWGMIQLYPKDERSKCNFITTSCWIRRWSMLSLPCLPVQHHPIMVISLFLKLSSIRIFSGLLLTKNASVSSFKGMNLQLEGWVHGTKFNLERLFLPNITRCSDEEISSTS